MTRENGRLPPMSDSNTLPKLHMAPVEPPEPAEMLERRVARENLDSERRHEFELEQSLAPFRVGSVDSLNAVPLTRGLEGEIKYAWPSQLAEMLRRDELDAALVSIVEVLFTDRYDVLDGIGIASLGEVKSVFLAHRKPLEEVREVYCDPASLTSVSLLKVLLAERGLKAEFKPLPSYDDAPKLDAVLLIGDRALDFSFAGHPHTLWDLGAAWSELTNLPLFMRCGRCGGFRTCRCAGRCVRRGISGWIPWSRLSAAGLNSRRSSGRIISGGTFIIILGRMRSGASNGSWSC